MSSHIPTSIDLDQSERILEITFDDGSQFKLSCEYLRVYSPSAEVQGHGPGQEILQIGKESVNILDIEPVGNYAVKLVFDDGHDSGLYTWQYLHELGSNQEEYWEVYLNKLEEAGVRRVQD
tara:strand:+ start:541 stop:903 length:363 start_codon:yes stop_codon:yes gene_type:complete